jgi:hypothetical protein
MTARALSSTLAPSFVSYAQASSPVVFTDLFENEESAAIVAETQSGENQPPQPLKMRATSIQFVQR